MDTFLTVTKALADESRIRILLALDQRELCLCQLVELLGFAPSTVSRHLELLQRANLVEQRKDGRWRYFRLAGPTAPKAGREALDWVRGNLEDDSVVSADRERLGAICGKSPAELSGFYRAHAGRGNRKRSANRSRREKVVRR